MADIFVSYKRQDRIRVEPLVNILKKQGWTVWWGPEIKPGTPPRDALIEKELRSARCVVVVWSELAADSNWVRTEASYGRSQQILVPVTIDGVVPITFKQTHTEILTHWNGRSDASEITFVIQGVHQILGKSNSAQASEEEATKPSDMQPSETKPKAVHQQPCQRNERQDWNAIRNTDNPDAVAAFLDKYPDGDYASFARSLFKGLTGEQEKKQKEIAAAELEAHAQEDWETVKKYGDDHAQKHYITRYGQTQFMLDMLAQGNAFIARGKIYYPNKPFRDAPKAPELVMIPPGKFIMGSADWEGDDEERPQHAVRIDYPLAVGRFAVTFDEWDYYASQVSNVHKPNDEGWGQGNRPVINVSWDDAQGYVTWLSEVTGENYRLLSEAEWEYVCRAGTNTRYWWGDEITHNQANYGGEYDETLPVGRFDPNPWGLYDIYGNVWEWVRDHWHDTYKGSPINGGAWEKKGDSRAPRVLRGGSWFSSPQNLRSANRFRNFPANRYKLVGFRISRTFTS